eukprot:882988-Alexandrium_andersonii.AAC.1
MQAQAHMHAAMHAFIMCMRSRVGCGTTHRGIAVATPLLWGEGLASATAVAHTVDVGTGHDVYILRAQTHA